MFGSYKVRMPLQTLYTVYTALSYNISSYFVLRYYYKNFYMLGKRPTEPDKPVRNGLQPCVSCDEYDHGSCRWYDEWNYDHINEYRQIKSNLQ